MSENSENSRKPFIVGTIYCKVREISQVRCFKPFKIALFVTIVCNALKASESAFNQFFLLVSRFESLAC